MGVTENCLISSTMEFLGFTWVLRGNFTFINPMIPMSFKVQNQEVLLSGRDGQLPDFIKNGTNRFVTGLSREFYFKEVNDTNHFEASKQGRTIEWE